MRTTEELYAAQTELFTHDGVNQRSKYVTQVQQQRPESVIRTWHECKYKVHKLHQKYTLYILKMYLWWSLGTSYLYACQVRITVGDSGVSCGTWVTYFER